MKNPPVMKIVTKPKPGRRPALKQDYDGDPVLSQSSGRCEPTNPGRNGRIAERDARRLGYY